MEVRQKLIVDSHFYAWNANGQERLITADTVFAYPAANGVVKIEIDLEEFWVRLDVLEAHTHVPA